MTQISKNGPADKWMLEGIKQHEFFQKAFQSAKEYALNAGLFFLSARQAIAPGSWLSFVAGYSNKISERSVHRYMEFATEVMEWTKAEYPDLVGEANLRKAALKLVLKSPKGYIALCRQLELMRKFGEYDEVKYRTRKLLDGQQVEFDFASALPTLDLLCDDKVHFKFAPGVNEGEALDALESKLQSALNRVRAIKRGGGVTPIDA